MYDISQFTNRSFVQISQFEFKIQNFYSIHYQCLTLLIVNTNMALKR